MWREYLDCVRGTAPRIHNITNYVTANDCANILLACGASPIMADDPAEAEEITAISSGLNLNMGTLNERKLRAMLLAGKRANALSHPVILDPVGVGASAFRQEAARALLDAIHFTVIRGNLSEIRTLYSGCARSSGVDASAADGITEDNLLQIAAIAREFSRRTGAVTVITGAVDLAADADRVYAIANGHPMMSRVTGTGCQLSALTAAFVTASPESPLEAAAAAAITMGVCGELAFQRLGRGEGTMTYRNYIIDAVSLLDGETLETQAKDRIL